MIDYREISPPPSLAHSIKCVWRLTGNAGPDATPEPIVPDGCVEIVVNLADPFARREPLSAPAVQPLQLVAGQLTRAATIAPTGRVDVWGVRFHPWAAASFLGVGAYELRDQIFALSTVATGLDRELESMTAIPESQRLEHLMRVLESHAEPRRVLEPKLASLIELSAIQRTESTVGGLAKRAGLSSRRVQMIFRDSVGLSPKQLMRLTRFQHALGMGRSNPSLTWSRIAATAGYHDHAHLLHESRAIAGCTPDALVGRPTELTSAFLRDDARC